ncbi:MAG TPA: sugar phosphate nucleotidyltransferase [Rhodothermales bacterium]
MKLIIPMAGRGTRVRPHSHVTPKPLLPVKGRNLVERIIDTFTRVLPRKADEAVFVLGPDFGEDIRSALRHSCEERGIVAHFKVQERAEGTAHAVDCAGEHLTGEGIIVYADTLFEMDSKVDLDHADVIAWVKEVPDPRRFGIAIREGDRVVRLEEKPANPVSNEALIGIYYVKDLGFLQQQIHRLIEQDIRGHGREFQLTDTMDDLLKANLVFTTATVTEWLDCGTIPALMDTTFFYLNKERDTLRAGTVEDCVIHEPVYVGPVARVVGSVLGPNVSVERGALVEGSILRDTIVLQEAVVKGALLEGSMVGAHAEVTPGAGRVNVGDHSTIA